MNEEILDEHLFDNNDGFVQPEVSNKILAQNWQSIIKKRNAKIEGNFNPFLLKFNFLIENKKQESIKINLFKELQSASGSVLPRVASTYKKLTIEKEIEGGGTGLK